MTLVSFWFVVLVMLWTGFLVLEGFDFGVGMLHGVGGRDEPGRLLAIRTIGPLWDGNEVWLIVAPPMCRGPRRRLCRAGRHPHLGRDLPTQQLDLDQDERVPVHE